MWCGSYWSHVPGDQVVADFAGELEAAVACPELARLGLVVCDALFLADGSPRGKFLLCAEDLHAMLTQDFDQLLARAETS